MGPAEKLFLAALTGALLELDTYFVGMLLISQPIIAGACAGFILGDVQTGIIIGSIAQLIWMSPPVGAYVPPSGSAIAFTATSAGIIMLRLGLPGGDNAVLMFALLGGVAFGYFVGQMDIWNRKLNTRIVHKFENKVKEGREHYVVLIQVLAVSFKLLRDVAGYILVLFFGIPLAVNIYSTLPEQVVSGLTLAYWVMPILGFSVLFEMFLTKAGAAFHGIVFITVYIIFSYYKGVNPGFLMLGLTAIGAFIVYNTVWSSVKN